MRGRSLALGCLLAAAVHGLLLWMAHIPEARPLIGDERMYWEAAGRIAAGRDAELSPLWPPLYPVLLGLLRRAFGDSRLAVHGLQILGLCFVALVVRDLCRRLLGSRRAGDLAALLTLAHPPMAAYATFLWPEVVHLVWFAAALWIAVARPAGLGWSAALGGVLGLALLTKSLLAPFLPALLVVALRRGGWRSRLLRGAVILAALGAILAPVLESNWRRHGVVAVADSSWFNLWVGLNDTARKDFAERVVVREFRAFERSAGSFRERNAALRARIAAHLRERGIRQTLLAQLGRQPFRLFDKDSLLLEQLPGGFFADRGRGYRAPPAAAAVLRPASYALYALALVAGVAGWLWAWRRAPGPAAFSLGFLLYHLALFLLLHVKARYRVPLLPFFFAYAGLALDLAWRRLRGEPAPARPRPRALVTWALVSSLLLLLAFGRPLIEAGDAARAGAGAPAARGRPASR